MDTVMYTYMDTYIPTSTVHKDKQTDINACMHCTHM